MRSDSDLTGRARIRDAALELFGAEGVNRVSVRAIAARAGVSAALVLHHFGSKEGLRRACDAYVVELVRGGPGADLDDVSGLAAMLEASSAMRLYLGRAFLDGSPAAAALFDDIVAAAERWLEEGVRTGRVRPSDDPRARAAVYVTWLLAPLTFGEHLARALPGGGSETDRTLRASRAGIEIFTRGLFTDDRVLDAWDAVREERRSP
ncbi:TetR family transcriptional regulator [Nonomuraea sp. NPDC049725]|uniref:TetR/AcrR family transcriptional regulator n=1 Tax=Nonomuraea sp. NPDC049725 TaxID=3154508 RepID=UPI00343CDC4E